ncbi:PPE domain-containing protein [Mycobacterium uberis]|nr:PPE domain-containing protein [Mycobacterium uberis]
MSPDPIAKNRSELWELIATNMLGQNLAAITAEEDEYEEHRQRNLE